MVRVFLGANLVASSSVEEQEEGKEHLSKALSLFEDLKVSPKDNIFCARAEFLLSGSKEALENAFGETPIIKSWIS
jgi:hypothetical protein